MMLDVIYNKSNIILSEGIFMYIFEVLYKEHENIHAFTDKLEQMAINFMEKNEISF